MGLPEKFAAMTRKQVEGFVEAGMDCEQDVLDLFDAAKSALDEVEQLRVQLGGCGAASFGYGEVDGKPVEETAYGYSVAYADVMRLYAKKEALRTRLEALTAACTPTAAERDLFEQLEPIGEYAEAAKAFGMRVFAARDALGKELAEEIRAGKHLEADQ